jgi:hypothetical protein
MLFSRAAWSMAMYFFATGEINFKGDQAIGELFSSPGNCWKSLEMCYSMSYAHVI